MCGFTAQLVEHLTGIAEVTGSNLVKALIFSGFSSFQLLQLLSRQSNGRSNMEVVGSIPTEVKRIFFLYLVCFPDSLY